MSFASPLFRSLAFSTTLLAFGASAQASGLTIPVNAYQDNSVLAFSSTALSAFSLKAVKVTVTPKGNASALSTTGEYKMPITSITISSALKIASGQAKGSALQITRLDSSGNTVGMTLANFTINYDTKQVLADATPLHGTTTSQLPLYTFNTESALALKYQFPLTITGHEVLNTLTLTSQAQTFFVNALSLPSYLSGVLGVIDFGSLTQDISTNLRKSPVSAKAYVPAP